MLAIYQYLGLVLMKLREKHAPAVYAFFEAFIENTANDPTAIEGFRDSFNELAVHNLALLEEKITCWFNKDNPRYHAALARISSNFWVSGRKSLQLSPGALDQLSAADVEYVLYKIAGYVHNKELLESLIFSSLQRKVVELSHRNVVLELFYHYISFNYPSTLDFLAAKKDGASPVELEVIDSLLTAINQRAQHHQQKPQELKPSPSRMQQIFDLRNKQLAVNMGKDPYRGPSVLDLVKKVSIKCGQSIFSRHITADGQISHTELSNMRSHSINYEAPSGEFLDPVGQAYNRYLWRIHQRRTI